MTKKKRTIMGSPLTPTLLKELDVISEFSSAIKVVMLTGDSSK